MMNDSQTIQDLDQGSGPNGDKPDGRNNRRFKNLLLAPSYQFRMGVIAILLAAAFGAAIAFLLYNKLGVIFSVMLDLTDAKEEVSQLLRKNITSLWWQFSAVLVAYLGLNIGFSVVITHRMVGPTYAFRRHIRSLLDGNYTARTRLREGDAFSEVAEGLNELSVKLEKQSGGKRVP